MRVPLLILIFCISILTSQANTNPIWGQTGHRVVGAVADQHLKGSTKRKLKKLLNHQSLALVSTFADEIKADARYDKFKAWHYLNMPLDGTYESSEKNPEGDLVTGIDYCISIITNDNTSNDDKAFYLKLLIHLIGDLHQPFHIGLKDDRGGNDFHVQWQTRDSNMHKVWDTQIIASYGMSYSELTNNLDYLTKAEIKAIKKGSILDWISETHQLTKVVYNSAKQGDNLGNAYSYKHLSMVKQQLQKAGIRLASILNTIL
ncbi:S1/P1 nuclease [uncultured Psychroserpens sp.]|uniref:S1/P1 nuclease n=1 Tax=uncultured Psychroserpens sp. TaxID=255436 RepID=UPI00260CE533|nr:S1/P1 nuclease [uncultured Psychroserpens sp.]